MTCLVILLKDVNFAIPIHYVSEIIDNPIYHTFGEKKIAIIKQKPVPVLDISDISPQQIQERKRGIVIKYQSRECMITIPGPCAIKNGDISQLEGISILNSDSNILMLDMDNIFTIIDKKEGINSKNKETV